MYLRSACSVHGMEHLLNAVFLANIDGTSDEHKAGAAMFASIQQVFQLVAVKHFGLFFL